jgi:hypothetical protein
MVYEMGETPLGENINAYFSFFHGFTFQKRQFVCLSYNPAQQF